MTAWQIRMMGNYLAPLAFHAIGCSEFINLAHATAEYAHVCPAEADICAAIGDVRFTPESGHVRRTSPCPLRAKSGHQLSMTSSANNRNDSGTVRSSRFAVFRFTTRLNFV